MEKITQPGKWAFGVAFVTLFIISGLAYVANNPQPQKGPGTYTVLLSIEGLYTEKTFTAAQGDTVLSLLRTAHAQDPSVRLKTKTYNGLGTLVESIGARTNGDGGRYWHYRVDGTVPQMGAEVYYLRDKDRVEWFFTESEQ